MWCIRHSIICLFLSKINSPNFNITFVCCINVLFLFVLLLGVSIKVLVVDLESDQVLPPTSVRGEQDWTVGELKTFLKSVSNVYRFYVQWNLCYGHLN